MWGQMAMPPSGRSPSLAEMEEATVAAAWRVEVADALWADCLSLPCSVGLTPTQQETVIAAVRAAAKGGRA